MFAGPGRSFSFLMLTSSESNNTDLFYVFQPAVLFPGLKAGLLSLIS